MRRELCAKLLFSYKKKKVFRGNSTLGGDSEMEPFDLWTKIWRRFKRILWLEDYHDLGDLFKGYLGCCRSTWL